MSFLLCAVAFGATWRFLCVTWLLLFVLRLDAVAFFRSLLFFAGRVEAFFPFAAACLPLVVDFFVTLEWVVFFVACAIARPFGAIIIPISKHPAAAATELLIQLRNIVSLFFLPTYLLYAARPIYRAILRLTESEQIRLNPIGKKPHTEVRRIQKQKNLPGKQYD